jgi:hypothetical protein
MTRPIIGKPKFADLNLLNPEDKEVLEVVKVSLNINVKHKCGSAHSYSVEFDVDAEDGLEQQLNEDLSTLVEMIQDRVHEGAVVVNDRTYIATETAYLPNPLLDKLLDRFPVMVMTKKVTAVPAPEPEPDTEEVAEEKSAEEVKPVYPDIQSPKGKKPKRRTKNERRLEDSVEPGEGTDDQGSEYDVRAPEGGGEESS